MLEILDVRFCMIALYNKITNSLTIAKIKELSAANFYATVPSAVC